MSEALPRIDGFRSAIQDTISRMRTEGYANKTVINYRYAMERTYEVLSQHGRPPRPDRMTAEHVAIVRQAFAYSQHFLSNVDSALLKMGCPHRIEYRIPPRSRVRWLERDRVCLVLDTALALGPPYATLVFLEAMMGFRRVSVVRARLQDFQQALVRVRAKGSERRANDYSLWPHRDLARILADTYAWRDRMGYAGRTDVLLPSGRTLGELSETRTNQILRRVAEESGVAPLGHHDLRRTFGRSHWKAGTPLPVIRDLLGHHSLDMTIRYLGIGADEMALAMNRLDEYMKTPSVFLVGPTLMEKK